MAQLKKKTKIDKAKRLFRVLVISTIIQLFAAPFFASIINQFMLLLFRMGTNGLAWDPDLNYIHSWKALLEEPAVRMWFFMLEAVYLFLILYIMIKPKAEISDVSTLAVTDKIAIPVPVGNGQHGNAHFATKNDLDEIYALFSFSGDESEVPAKGGLVIEMQQHFGKELVRYVSGGLHSLILGSTGSGKTRRILLETIWLQLITGTSIILSDVKGELFYYTSSYARDKGYKVRTLDLRNPKKSDHYNFLQPILDALDQNDKAEAVDKTWDLVSALVGEAKGEPLWHNGETATIAAGILAVAMEAPENCRNLTNVYYFLGYMGQANPETGITPLTLYLDELADNHPAKSVFLQGQIAAERTRSSFYTSALGTLKLFTDPNIAEMTSCSDYRLEDIGKEKTIVYMIIPDERKTRYPLGSIFVTQSYIANVEVANNNGGRTPVPIDYDLDEAGNFPTIPVIPAIATAGRSRGVRMNLVLQDYQQLESKYKEDFETIKNNCRVKVYLKSDSAKTLKEISENLGKYTVEVTSASSSASYSRYNDGSVSTSSNMTGRELLMPSELSLIDAPYALVMNQGNLPAITKLPDLSQYRINKIWGLGDEEHNNRIIMERENTREERQIEDIPLWGIWNQYKELLEESNSKAISFL